jgi:hypothetical protein
MARAFLLIRLTLVLTGVVCAAGIARAGGPGDSAPRPGGSFGMVTATTANGTRVTVPSPGASLAPKAVVRNPYNVPLLQNAGSLRAGR